MKDLKVVLLLALPLVVVVGGFLLYDALVGPPATPPVEPPRVSPRPVPPPSGRTPAGGGAATAVPVPVSPLPPAFTPGMVPEDFDTVLTVERTKALLADGSLKAWSDLEILLRGGEVVDPVAVGGLLVEALAAGGNTAALVYRVLPCLRDEQARAAVGDALLVAAAEVKEPNAIKAAFGLLGQFGRPDCAAALADLARAQERQEYFTPAVYALADIGGPEAAGELARLLSERAGNDGDEAVLLNAIGRCDTPEKSAAMVAGLVPLTSRETPVEVRLAAIRALGATRAPEAVARLTEVLKTADAMEVREAAIVSLSRVGNEEAVETLLRMRREGGDTAILAGRALENVNLPEAVPALVRALPAEDDEQVRVRMVTALGKIGSREAVPALRERFSADGETPSVRGRSARALAEIGDVESLDSMLDVLKKPPAADEGNLRLEIVFALQAFVSHEAARPDLLQKAVPVLREVERAAGPQDPLHHYANRALMQLEAFRPRESPPR